MDYSVGSTTSCRPLLAECQALLPQQKLPPNIGLYYDSLYLPHVRICYLRIASLHWQPYFLRVSHESLFYLYDSLYSPYSMPDSTTSSSSLLPEWQPYYLHVSHEILFYLYVSFYSPSSMPDSTTSASPLLPEWQSYFLHVSHYSLWPNEDLWTSTSASETCM